MAEKIATFDTGHSGPVHDAQLDYYSRKLATCSADGLIRIWDVTDPEKPAHSADLRGHEGAVWQVVWAHPKYGSVVASSGYDKRVVVWKEMRVAEWQVMYANAEHLASVNCVAFCHHELGLILACGSSDGTVSILKHNTGPSEDYWTRQVIDAHPHGVNAVSWAPLVPNSTTQELVTGGCDNQVKVWKLQEGGLWAGTSLQATTPHTDWVRDVAWRPNSGLLPQCIASCSEDETVILWIREGQKPWQVLQVIKLKRPAWKVSWSVTGTL
eukprot:Platyproteum_vivax@DN2345_c0_g1_i2.p1